jgi:NADH-quinone oxidoreductase E subunit
MEIKFNEQDFIEIEKLKAKYPTEQSALMGVLWLAQQKFGWISPEVIAYVAEVLNLPPAHVDGVAKFYTMYFKKPMGKYHIQVCTNVSCMLRGGQQIWEHLQKKLNIGNMEASEDGRYSLEEVECMGACGGAPMIAINEDYYENMSIEKVEELINSLK